ncbi:YncE family protein [Rhodococcus wratislaviensis]|nr:PQQ-binding-like beta-propeller repeat protein [Rhodococcus wratislaviensis]
MAKDVRETVVTGAWERTWVSLDDSRELTIRIYEVRLNTSTFGEPNHCRNGQALDAGGSGRMARSEGAGQTHHFYCAQVNQNRVRAYVDLRIRPAAKDIADPAATLRAVLDSIDTQPSPDVPLPEDYVSEQRSEILEAWILAVPIAAFLSVAPPVLFDRASLQALVSRMRRRRMKDNHVDVSALASATATRSRGIGLVRLAALVWTVRSSEELQLGMYHSLALLAGVYILSLLIERRLMGIWVKRTAVRTFTGARAIWVVIGSFCTLLVAFGAIVLWAIGAAFASGSSVPGVADWDTHRNGVALEVVAAGVLFGSFLPLAFTRRIAMKRPQSTTSDSRAPVLLLRSFIDDSIRMRCRRLDRASIFDQIALRRWERFEEVAASALSKIGPVLAVGTPGEILPPGLGAARINFTHDEWQEGIRQIADQSAFLVMTLGRTESLVWEIRQLRDHQNLDKTIFLLPPLSQEEITLRLRTLAHVYGVSLDSLQPERGSTPLAIAFPPGRESPIVAVSRGADDLSYDAAINLAAAALLRADPTAPTPTGAGRVENPPDMIPLGKAKRHRTWKRNPWVWNAILTITVLTIAVPYLMGGTVGQQVEHAVVLINPEYRVSHVLPGTDENPLVVIDNQALAQIDFAADTVTALWNFTEPVERVAVMDKTVFATNRNGGGVSAYELESGKRKWHVSVGAQVRGLTLGNDRVYVAVPGDQRIVALKSLSGDIDADAYVVGHPWDISSSGNFVYTVLIDTNEIIQFDANSLLEAGRLPTQPAPSQLTQWGGAPVVISRVNHTAIRVDDSVDPTTIYLSRTDGEVAGQGEWLLAEGHERVTAFDLAGSVVRTNTMGSNGGGIALTDAGLVVAESGMVRLYT